MAGGTPSQGSRGSCLTSEMNCPREVPFDNRSFVERGGGVKAVGKRARVPPHVAHDLGFMVTGLVSRLSLASHSVSMFPVTVAQI